MVIDQNNIRLHAPHSLVIGAYASAHPRQIVCPPVEVGREVVGGLKRFALDVCE